MTTFEHNPSSCIALDEYLPLRDAPDREPAIDRAVRGPGRLVAPAIGTLGALALTVWLGVLAIGWGATEVQGLIGDAEQWLVEWPRALAGGVR